MRSWLRFLLDVCACCLVLYLLLSAFHLLQSRWQAREKFENVDIPQHMREYCQFIDYPPLYYERDALYHTHELFAVLLVARHGERAPLAAEVLHPSEGLQDKLLNNDCSLHNVQLERKYDALRKRIDEMMHSFTVSEHTRNLMSTFPLYPHTDQCAPSKMTALGALQHEQFGKHIRSVYNELVQNNALVHLYTTNTERTYQSLLAFAAGAFPRRTNLPLHIFDDLMLCDDDECRQCNRKQREAHGAYWHARNNYRRKNLTYEEVSRLTALRQILGLGEERDAIEVFDYIAGTYACRSRQLPRSVHWSDTQLLLDIVARREHDLGDRYDRRLQTMLQARPTLRTLLVVAKNLTINRYKQIRVYSAHDITLVPLLHHFSLFDGRIPHYRAHIAFELWLPKEQSAPIALSDIRLRVLYNGGDMTANLPFCKAIPCSAMHLQTFFDNAPSVLNISPLEKFCT